MPRLIPVMLIHGFDGTPAAWTDSGFRQYLITNGDLDPNLVRLFDFGIAADGTYNNRGDLRQIAARLAGASLEIEERFLCSVDQLSDNSLARGGPAQVTLIGHSLGGIISRYYLSRSAPDEWGCVYRGNVGRLITIGTPHRGADLARLVDLAPRGSPMWWFVRLLERLGLAPALPASTVEKMSAELQARQMAERVEAFPGSVDYRTLLTDTPIYSQLHPDSPLLAELNRAGALPEHVACHALYGDIRYGVRVRAGRVRLLDYSVSFGDLVVTTRSASEIPGARCTSHPFVGGMSLDLTLRSSPQPQELRSLRDYLPSVAHNRQLSNEEVQKTVLEILTA